MHYPRLVRPCPPATTEPPEIWYAGYGSNLSPGRFGLYLSGGLAEGSRFASPGSRLRRPFAEAVAVELPGRIWFAGESVLWGGGVARYDHDWPGPTPGVAYRITVGQFVDVVRQEMKADVREQDPMEAELLQWLCDGLPTGRCNLGDGHYETVVEIARRGGLPMLTITAAHRLDDEPHTSPEPAYLAMMSRGLREMHGWDDERCTAYLASRMGR